MGGLESKRALVPSRTRRSLAAIRLAAAAPRIVFVVACALLALVGGSALLLPKRPPAATGRSGAPVDLGARAFAEAFAHAYLTWDSNAPQLHERAVGRFVAAGIDPAAGVVVPATGSQRVRWTAVAADRNGGERRRIVTIAADTSRGLVHLAVPVSRDPRGLLFVSALPAVIGPPAHTTRGPAVPEPEVEDRRLRALSSRVVRNYLAGERDDLAADLDSDALVSLPDGRMNVRSTDAVTWVSEPRRVAIAVTAQAPGGPRLALRYELSVLRIGGRWVVRTIHTNPIAREGDR